MLDKPKKYQRHSSKTGIIPNFDYNPEKTYEPPQPPTLPEFDQDDGATGVIILRAEGDDAAKEAEDDPIAGARTN